MSLNTDRLIPAEEALSIVLDSARVLPSVSIDIQASAGRILSADLSALRTQPPFDASAMDGYAVRQDDISELPANLNVIGVSRAGEPFDGTLTKGQAVRIFTGAVVPEGADSIVIQENTESLSDNDIRVLHGVEKGKFIRQAGLDFKYGDILLRAGDPLTPNRISLAASMNHALLNVVQQPKVALMATGDELILPGGELKSGQIIASNTFGLNAACRNHSALIDDYGIVADSKEALSAAFKGAIEAGCDLILTTGGASVGDHDLILPVAREVGFDIKITKIAMRPGKPFIFGTLHHAGRTIYLTGLAGNPVSSLVAFNVFVRPLIQALSGHDVHTENRQSAILGSNLPENDERAEYMRAMVETSKTGESIVTPFTRQDSSMLANLVRANCLLYRPVKAPAAKIGDPCEIILIS